jgi:uncharacterized protein YecE (DUF72 family)
MAGRVYIGIAGWSYPDWKGIVYTGSKIDQLAYISRFVDCVEINNTFYRPPSDKTTMSWLKNVSGKPEFFFTAKLHRDFSHEGKLDAEMVEQFHKGFQPMLDVGKLRHLLVQFRYDFADCEDNRQRLAKIVESFSIAFNLVVEVRHKSWQQEGALKFLDELGVSVCNLDYPTGPDSFDMQDCTVGRNGYFRLHGRNREKWFSRASPGFPATARSAETSARTSRAGRDEVYNYYYNRDELAGIKERIVRLAAAFETLTVIANNHYRGAELANAIELKVLLSGQKQFVPEALLRTYPNLASIALETGNNMLWDGGKHSGYN